ncbi:hypothetical protein DERF_006515 [Dermatophagoides farinae]|uniref:Uncharacterized protein n=1 Tax=Dermatophagoides farinae TaxID=6954 RepID=A0A922I6D8_DERFA|nr:hypothetical protein DERF_006515 [Dermatophagoides farinae]
MFLSPSPSNAAPKSYGPLRILSTRSAAYVRFGSGWWPPKSGRGSQRMAASALAPSSCTMIRRT